MKKKGFIITEAIITGILIILMVIGIIGYGNAKEENQKIGAQLSVMKLFHTQKLYYKENNQYTSDLNKLWNYHLKIIEYPVTIVDVRERAINKHEKEIFFLRIGDYKINIKTGEGNQSFIIEAIPIETTLSKDLPTYQINDKKELISSDKWFIDTSK